MQALCFSPNIISPILVGLIWVFILDPQIGFVNAFLRAIGSSVPTGVDWWKDLILTPYCIAIIFLWQTLGYNATIFFLPESVQFQRNCTKQLALMGQVRVSS